MRRALAAGAVAVTLFLQFVVPAYQLLGEKQPNWFGWQMYAAITPSVEFRVDTPSGQLILGPDDVGGYRAEVDYAALAPPQICALVEATALEVWVAGELHATEVCP